jgi:hypothetical protein
MTSRMENTPAASNAATASFIHPEASLHVAASGAGSRQAYDFFIHPASFHTG